MQALEFFQKALPLALASEHIFPEYAACEAAEESRWGESWCATKANNLFGQKPGFSTKGMPTIDMPTHEWIKPGKPVPAEMFGRPVTVASVSNAGTLLACLQPFVHFESWQQSFEARMRLMSNSHLYVHAMDAETGEEYVKAVSAVWATDPARANIVLSIYRKHQCLLESLVPAAAAAGGK